MLKKLWCALIHRKRHLWKGGCCKCNPKIITNRDCLILAEWAMQVETDNSNAKGKLYDG